MGIQIRESTILKDGDGGGGAHTTGGVDKNHRKKN